jgi:hypothetical protein
MAKISMIVADADLALIDEVATPNRTAFMVQASKQAAARVLEDRLNAEIARCLAESADDDRALLEEFAGVTADGL